MSSSGGNNFTPDWVDDLVADPLGTIANIGVNVSTGGMAGYDSKTGKIKKGVQLKAFDETWGEITGRNMKRKALNEQNEKITKAEEEMRTQKRIEGERKEAIDRQSSFAALSVRNGNSAFNPEKAVNTGDPERDFLGL